MVLPEVIEEFFKQARAWKDEVRSGRDVDAKVAERVFGWRAIDVRHIRGVGCPGRDEPCGFSPSNPSMVNDEVVPWFSTSIADAMKIIEKLNAIWFFECEALPGDCSTNINPKWKAKFWDAEPCIGGRGPGIAEVSGLEEFEGCGDTLPEAICMAALKLAKAQQPKG